MIEISIYIYVNVFDANNVFDGQLKSSVKFFICHDFDYKLRISSSLSGELEYVCVEFKYCRGLIFYANCKMPVLLSDEFQPCAPKI